HGCHAACNAKAAHGFGEAAFFAVRAGVFRNSDPRLCGGAPDDFMLFPLCSFVVDLSKNDVSAF
ncbi:MAG: hypothetical protein WAU37_08585, partial [Formosimonas sp.]